MQRMIATKQARAKGTEKRKQGPKRRYRPGTVALREIRFASVLVNTQNRYCINVLSLSDNIKKTASSSSDGGPFSDWSERLQTKCTVVT